MRIMLECGLLFGAVVLLPSAATAQFAESRRGGGGARSFGRSCRRGR
jgi:hypothetical protein